jgi:hypothetical protein
VNRIPRSFFVLNHIHILHQNICGLLNKTDLLNVYIEELREDGYDVDVICLTEHFMLNEDKTNLLICNYKLAYIYSRDSRRGGSCILIRQGYEYKTIEVSKYCVKCIFECCAIELLQPKVIIICIYKPPKSDFDTFLEKMSQMLDYISQKKNKKIVLCGDFNVDMLKKNRMSLDFKNLLLNHDLKLQIVKPTRPCSNTCIDNFATNIRLCKSDILDFNLSDHTAQLLSFPSNNKCNILSSWRIRKRDMSKDNITKFCNAMENLTFSEIYKQTDVNLAYNTLYDTIHMFHELCFPYITVIIKSKKKQRWISRGIRLCSKNKRKLLWNYRKSPTLANNTFNSKESKQIYN